MTWKLRWPRLAPPSLRPWPRLAPPTLSPGPRLPSCGPRCWARLPSWGLHRRLALLYLAQPYCKETSRAEELAGLLIHLQLRTAVMQAAVLWRMRIGRAAFCSCSSAQACSIGGPALLAAVGSAAVQVCTAVLHTPQRTPHTAHFTIHTAGCMLHTKHCRLNAALYLLKAVSFTGKAQ